jgi:hypothetical protein
MRITIDLDELRVRKAKELTGLEDERAIIREGLEALIAREKGRRLLALGGSQPALRAPRRRRPRPRG